MSERWGLVAGIAAATALAAGVMWPLPLELTDAYQVSAFGGDHVWAFDHIAQMLAGREPLSTTVRTIGYPYPRDARLLLWGPALLALPLRPLLGPLGAFNVVVLLSPALSVAAAWAFLRRLSGASGLVCAAAALTYAFSPFALGSLASGQIAKIQLWIPPLVLLAIHGAVHGPRRGRWLGILAVSMLVGVFTSPSTVVYLPFAAAAMCLMDLWRAPQPRGPTALRMALAAAVCVACLAPAAWYYRTPADSDVMPAFMPATPPQDVQLPIPSPYAQPLQTLLGIGMWDVAPPAPRGAAPGDNPRLKRRVVHLTYLGLPLLLFGLVLSLRGSSGRGLGWALVILGLVLAAGPFMTLDNAYVLRDGRRQLLPVWLLDQAGYPTAESGQYYRAIHLASLGLALVLAAGLRGLRPWVAAGVAWGMVALHGLDVARVTEPLWPLKVEPVEGRDALVAMARDPTPGAVLEVPVRILDFQSQELMLAAVFHRRPTTALPQDRNPAEDPSVAQLMASLRAALEAGSPDEVSAALGDLGFRYVLWRPYIPTFIGEPPDVEAALGPPHVDGQLRYWQVGAR